MSGDYSLPQVIENDDPNDEKYSSWDEFVKKQHSPIVVIDDVFTIRSASTDRALMVDVAEYLANKIETILKDDSERNRRYATGLVITTMRVEGPEAGTREKICIPLPTTYAAWNEIDVIELQFLMLRRLNPQPANTTWYKVRALLTNFIDKETFDNLNALEAKGGISTGGQP